MKGEGYRTVGDSVRFAKPDNIKGSIPYKSKSRLVVLKEMTFKGIAVITEGVVHQIDDGGHLS